MQGFIPLPAYKLSAVISEQNFLLVYKNEKQN